MTTLINVGKLLITLPLKTLESMLDIAHSIREEYLAISQTLEDTQENFSSMSKQGQGFIRLTAQIRGLGTAFLNVNSEAAKTFGYGLEGQKAMAAAVRETVTAMGSLGNLYSDAYQDNGITAERALRSLGMSVEDNMFMMRRSMSEGIHPFRGLAKAIYASNQAQNKFGVDQKQVAKGMNVLRKNVVEFSHLSEQEFANVTAQAAQLGVEAEGLVSIFNKFTTFESAAESAALLSQTFGMAIDAMDIIRAEDPMEILNQFREGMIQTGRDFRDLNRHEKALLSQYTGLNGEMLQTAMSFEGMGLSYQELQQKMKESSPEHQLKEAVKEMSGSIKEFVNVGKKLTSPFQAMSEGMKDALVKNTRFQKSMMGLSNSIQNIYTKVLNNFLSKDLLDSIDNIIGTFAKLIDDDVANGFVTLSKNIASFINVLIDVESTPEKIQNSFSKMYDSFMNSKFVSRLFLIGQRMVGGIISGMIKSLPALVTGFIDLLRLFNGTFKGNSYSDPKTGLGKFFKKYVLDSWDKVKGILTDKKDLNGKVISEGLISQLITEFKNAVSTSGSILADIGGMIVTGIWEGIKLTWSSLGGWEKLAIGAGIFGPSILSTAGTFMLGGRLAQTAASASSAASAAALAAQQAQKNAVKPASPAPAALPSNTNTASTAMTAPKPRSSFLSKGVSAATKGFAGIGGALSGYSAYQQFKSGNYLKGALSSITSIASIASLFPLAAPIAAPIALLSGVANSFISEKEAVQAKSNTQIEETRKVSEAITKQASQPIMINLSIKQMLDGDELTNKIISAAINGTTQYNINTDNKGNMTLLSKNANDAGGYNPVPLA
jgi:hypothetical protein